MIRLNRTSEYGLMALRHMSRKSVRDASEVTSAREIADCYGLPFEITAKTLQRLKDTGLIQSAHGAKGGYTLVRPLNEVSLGEFLELMEGRQSLVACAGNSASAGTSLNGGSCEYGSRCEIHNFMNRVNHRLLGFLSEIRLAELAELNDETSSSLSSIGLLNSSLGERV